MGNENQESYLVRRLDALIKLSEDPTLAESLFTELDIAFNEGDEEFVDYLLDQIPEILPKVGKRLKDVLVQIVDNGILNKDEGGIYYHENINPINFEGGIRVWGQKTFRFINNDKSQILGGNNE